MSLIQNLRTLIFAFQGLQVTQLGNMVSTPKYLYFLSPSTHAFMHYLSNKVPAGSYALKDHCLFYVDAVGGDNARCAIIIIDHTLDQDLSSGDPFSRVISSQLNFRHWWPKKSRLRRAVRPCRPKYSKTWCTCQTWLTASISTMRMKVVISIFHA